MFKAPSPDDTVVAPVKNRLPEMKRIAWAYVVTALLYLVAGGPPRFGLLFLMMTFFAGALILQNSEKREQVGIACVMVVFLLINAAYMMLLPQHSTAQSENMVVAVWIIEKLWYVVGLALLLPLLVDPLVKKSDKHRARAIALAFSAQCLLTFYMHHDKEKESHAPVECLEIVGKICTPVAKPAPWYTRATLAEDLVTGLQVVLLMAAFSKKEE